MDTRLILKRSSLSTTPTAGKSDKNPMKDWKAAVRTWEKRKANDRASPPGKPSQRTLGNDARWDEYLAKQEVKNASQ